MPEIINVNRSRPEEVITAFASSGGSFELVGERFALSKAEIFQILLDNQDLLAQAVRMAALVMDFQMSGYAFMALREKMQELKPYELAKIQASTTNNIHHMTSNAPTVNINADFDRLLLDRLPPEIREPMMVLLSDSGGGNSEEAA